MKNAASGKHGASYPGIMANHAQRAMQQQQVMNKLKRLLSPTLTEAGVSRFLVGVLRKYQNADVLQQLIVDPGLLEMEIKEARVGKEGSASDLEKSSQKKKKKKKKNGKKGKKRRTRGGAQDVVDKKKGAGDGGDLDPVNNNDNDDDDDDDESKENTCAPADLSASVRFLRRKAMRENVALLQAMSTQDYFSDDEDDEDDEDEVGFRKECG